MEFNVGDNVRVRKDLVEGKTYGGIVFFKSMRYDEIRKIYRRLITANGSFYQTEELGYWYTADMLELVLVLKYNKPTDKEIEKLYEVE